MKTEQAFWARSSGWSPHAPGQLPGAQLVLVFAGRELLENAALLSSIRSAYPHGRLVGCSTAGEICGTRVRDDTLVVTAVEFTHGRIETGSVRVEDPGQSRTAGNQLAGSIPHENLRHAFVLSDGLGVNGSELVRGLMDRLPAGVAVTGGLSGDGEQFGRTLVAWDDVTASNMVGIVGFYGDRLKIGCGSLGGWDPFGPERLITKSAGNVLYELDGRSALELYKTYLGEHAEALPASGLLFPLSLRGDDANPAVVRTILAIDEKEQSMTFAGDMPVGAYARLMKANFDRLVDGASGAAHTSLGGLSRRPAELAILISCVGRKLVLKQRIEEEVEAVRDVLGSDAILTGFYSYGEISPFTPSARCELHNQTMTITTFSESDG